MGFLDSKSSTTSTAIETGLDYGASNTVESEGDSIVQNIAATAAGSGSVLVGDGRQLVITGNAKSSVAVDNSLNYDESVNLGDGASLLVDNSDRSVVYYQSTEALEMAALAVASFATYGAEYAANLAEQNRQFTAVVGAMSADYARQQSALLAASMATADEFAAAVQAFDSMPAAVVNVTTPAPAAPRVTVNTPPGAQAATQAGAASAAGAGETFNIKTAGIVAAVAAGAYLLLKGRKA